MIISSELLKNEEDEFSQRKKYPLSVHIFSTISTFKTQKKKLLFYSFKHGISKICWFQLFNVLCMLANIVLLFDPT